MSPGYVEYIRHISLYMSSGYVECIRLLLEHGAKPVRTLTGWTPAHFAAETGKLSALRALHSAGVRLDKKDNYGCTPKRLAEIYNHTECLKFLIQWVSALKIVENESRHMASAFQKIKTAEI